MDPPLFASGPSTLVKTVEGVTVTSPVPLKLQPLLLHPVQAVSHDQVVRTSKFNGLTGTFTVPARTTAVFIAPCLGFH